MEGRTSLHGGFPYPHLSARDIKKSRLPAWGLLAGSGRRWGWRTAPRARRGFSAGGGSVQKRPCQKEPHRLKTGARLFLYWFKRVPSFRPVEKARRQRGRLLPFDSTHTGPLPDNQQGIQIFYADMGESLHIRSLYKHGGQARA